MTKVLLLFHLSSPSLYISKHHDCFIQLGLFYFNAFLFYAHHIVMIFSRIFSSHYGIIVVFQRKSKKIYDCRYLKKDRCKQNSGQGTCVLPKTSI